MNRGAPAWTARRGRVVRAGSRKPARVPVRALGAQGAGARPLRRGGRFGVREAAGPPVLAAGREATSVALVRSGQPAASQGYLGGEARRSCAHAPAGLQVQELHGFLLSCGSWAPRPPSRSSQKIGRASCRERV